MLGLHRQLANRIRGDGPLRRRRASQEHTASALMAQTGDGVLDESANDYTDTEDCFSPVDLVAW